MRQFPTTAIAMVTLVLTLALTAQPGATGRRQASQPAFQLEEATIGDIRAAFDAETLTCWQLVRTYLERIAAYEDNGPRLNSITTINPKALEEATALDGHRRRSGSKGPLHCIPVLLKDNIGTADMPTSNGSVILRQSIPPHDAHVTKALREAGALILGKAAMGEFAGGSYNTIDGQTVNPYNFERDTGGSSSGSAAAVSANFTVLAIGTDTGTSVRAPAAFTGIVGLRPTTGLISRAGIAPKNLNFDTPGPMARTVTDMAILLNAIAGPDPDDPHSVQTHRRYPAASTTRSGYADFTRLLKGGALKGAHLGVVRDFFGGDPEIDALANRAIARMRDLGAEIVEVQLDPALIDFYVRRVAIPRGTGSYRFRADWEAYLETLGPGVPKSVTEFLKIYETEVARSALPADASVLDLMKEALATSTDDPFYQNMVTKVLPQATRLKVALFDKFKLDALVFPYHPRFAAPIDNPVKRIVDPSYVAAKGRPEPSILAGHSSVGFPCIVVPMGFGSQGLPAAISFMGRPYDEARIIGYAYDYEQATKMRRPSPLLPTLPAKAVAKPHTAREH